MSVTTTQVNETALVGRELQWAVNEERHLNEHREANGPIVRTRFPPEPNGYLHIGHAKSMNMNFRLAFEKLGVPMEHRRTIFRYDDTNPDAESKEYVDSLRRDLEWLGWKPERTTYSSDNFQLLYEMALSLIRKGLAYVCDMTKDEMEQQRELALSRVVARNRAVAAGIDYQNEPSDKDHLLPGRNRDTPVERNLALFERMKRGCFPEGKYTLRLKMDFESDNPNMYDLVAYRVKFTEHPHAGDRWCIYPSYDYTHGVCDSLEHVDYSICTLEFETRREPYFWILWALDMYRPRVYEMSRLNLAYTVLSKRRLLKLVTSHTVRGWDDPRMPTLSGLRRRGYRPEILNKFCMDVGATRSANVVEYEKLTHVARTFLAPLATRVMAVLEPVKVIVTNWDEALREATAVATSNETTYNANANVNVNVNATSVPFQYRVDNSPTDPSQGSHTVTLTSTFYIDATDFRTSTDNDDNNNNNDSSYYGLAPGKAVGLKYHGGNLVCDKYETTLESTTNQSTLTLYCRIDSSEGRPKPKSYLTWVPDTGLPCEVRVYHHLFVVAEPTDRWEEELNPRSEVVHPRAMVDPSVATFLTQCKMDRWNSAPAFQFERMGYFVLDNCDTCLPQQDEQTPSRLVFNRTVSLREEVAKTQERSLAEEAAMEERRRKTKTDAEAKEARMKITPENLFREAPEYQGKYSKFNDDTGLPTHDVNGTELTKSALKKLEKERQKHIKQLSKFKATKK